MVVTNGFGAAWPRPHQLSIITAAKSSSRSRSHLSLPMIFGLFLYHSARCALTAAFIPEEVHQVFDHIFHVVLIAQDHNCCRTDEQPCSCKVSKSKGTSPNDAGKIPPEAPPGRYALKLWPSSMPPQYSSISCVTVVPAAPASRLALSHDH